MTNKIFKYPMYGGAAEIPRGAVIVLVGEQDNTPTIWAVIDDSIDYPALATYRIFGTGHECPSANHHVGSVVCSTGYVWHVFKMD